MTGPKMLDGIEELLAPHRERLSPPTETLSMFLAQVLSADGSCQQAVNDAALKRLVGGLPRCGTSTSAYCQARARLPTEIVDVLTRQVGCSIRSKRTISCSAMPATSFIRIQSRQWSERTSPALRMTLFRTNRCRSSTILNSGTRSPFSRQLAPSPMFPPKIALGIRGAVWLRGSSRETAEPFRVDRFTGPQGSKAVHRPFR